MSIIQFQKIKKDYDETTVIEDFSLDIQEKEFVVLLGPSGSGKSTTLRMLAGLEEITGGELLIKDKVVNEVPSKDRGIAMVFQNYALYPHMNVEQNIGFGEKMRGTSKKEVKEKVDYAMDLLNLTVHRDKKPGNLSGGQQQRVALGRAIVRDSEIFLMDEPLSNLDARLRSVMREEIVRLHNELNATTVYVTHDQIEAMTMADRIVVMNEGYIQQVDTPKNIYDYPANTFVANFIGSPSMNLVQLTRKDNSYYLDETPLNIQAKEKDLTLGIRPEDLFIDESSSVRMTISYLEDHGSDKFITGRLNQTPIVIKDSTDIEYEIGQNIGIGINRKKASYFNSESGMRVDDVIWD